MKDIRHNLTTADGIIAAYQALDAGGLLTKRDAKGLLTDLSKLFAQRPAEEIAATKEFGVADRLLNQAYHHYRLGSGENRQVVNKGLALVDACMAAKEFGMAGSLLERAYYNHPHGSSEERQVVEKGMALVDACVAAEDFGMADSLLERAYRSYPIDFAGQVVLKGLALVDACAAAKEFSVADRLLHRACDWYSPGSAEKRQVVEKGLALVEACMAAKEFGVADRLLGRAHRNYPDGSVERHQVAVKQQKLKKLLGAEGAATPRLPSPLIQQLQQAVAEQMGQAKIKGVQAG